MSSIPVSSHLVGDVWPAAAPAENAVLYGHVELEPRGAFAARSLQTFTMTYTVGRYGLDDTGAIRVVFRYPGDGGKLQTGDPAAANFVTASASNGTPLDLTFDSYGHARPWFKALTVLVSGGCLREGDSIAIVFGDRSGGSPGMKLQTFCESAYEFKVLADVCATGLFAPIPDTPVISIVPDEAATWKAVVPTRRGVGEPFYLGIKAEDRWGNPSDKAAATLRIESNLPVAGLPRELAYGPGDRSLRIDDLSVAEEGTLRIAIRNESSDLLAAANPLVVASGAHGAFWGDLHGQSGESVGINTAREYFTFGRDLAFLDLCSHQANDFQVNNAFWREVNDLSAEFNEEGRFVTFPGYEWSGNTAVGGDRNVYYRAEGRPIRRSSHALLPDRSDIDTDSPTARQLFEDLQDEDCFVYAHVGGRYADIAYAHDARLETAMEIHSAWGTFEWLLTDSFELGYRSGVVCNSDGHKGRPGASYPGASSFGAYGGLTCFLASELTRDAIIDSVRRRHHYGTTGNRIYLEVRARFGSPSRLFDSDPAVYRDARYEETNEAMMGDIVWTPVSEVEFSLDVRSHTPIERIDVLVGAECHTTLRGYGEDELGSRIRVIWSGAEYRGRGRQTHWEGEVTFPGAGVKRLEKINAWNPEHRFELAGENQVLWDSVTAGNFAGFDAWLDEGEGARVEISSNHVSGEIALPSLGLEPIVLDAGGLQRRITVARLPDLNACLDMKETVRTPVAARGDTPIWVRVTTEDGFNAWSSPIYLFREL